MNQECPRRFSTSAAGMIGMPLNDPSASKSLSPVTIASASAATAQARTWMSSGSRNSAGGAILAGRASWQAARKRSLSDSAVSPFPANRSANFGFWSVSLYSRSSGKERNILACPLSAADTSRAGGPCQREPETNRVGVNDQLHAPAVPFAWPSPQRQFPPRTSARRVAHVSDRARS